MQVEISSSEVALRLLLALLAGAVLGANRGERGRAAGLRTTILVCLTAAGSMILGNLLMSSTGRPWDSFVQMDIMRLPLGILTGMGFIGAGAILHRGNLVVGVTTAATLWFTTVMGFCFGAGETGLGLALLGLGGLVLWGLKWMEVYLDREREALFTILVDGEDAATQVTATLPDGFRAELTSAKWTPDGMECAYRVHWHSRKRETVPPDFLQQAIVRSEVKRVEWIAIAGS